jgi:prepilin-type N-terminal cleavage/methylation domain-containing protein
MHTHPPPSRAASRGFTLIELAVVIFIVALIAAVTFPQLLPIIVFSQHEAAARRIAAFGDAAIAHATLRRETITVRFVLEEQSFEATHWVNVAAEAEGESGEPDQLALLEGLRGGEDMDPEALAELMAGGGDPGSLPEGFDLEKAQAQLGAEFDLFARKVLEAQARNVKHPEGMLGDISLFDEEDDFSLEAEQWEELPVDDPLLARDQLPLDVALEAIWIDGERHTRGTVELELTPLGLAQLVGFYLRNEDGEYYTVIWDPLASRARIRSGAVELL